MCPSCTLSFKTALTSSDEHPGSGFSMSSRGIVPQQESVHTRISSKMAVTGSQCHKNVV